MAGFMKGGTRLRYTTPRLFPFISISGTQPRGSGTQPHERSSDWRYHTPTYSCNGTSCRYPVILATANREMSAILFFVCPPPRSYSKHQRELLQRSCCLPDAPFAAGECTLSWGNSTVTIRAKYEVPLHVLLALLLLLLHFQAAPPHPPRGPKGAALEQLSTRHVRQLGRAGRAAAHYRRRRRSSSVASCFMLSFGAPERLLDAWGGAETELQRTRTAVFTLRTTS